VSALGCGDGGINIWENTILDRGRLGIGDWPFSAQFRYYSFHDGVNALFVNL